MKNLKKINNKIKSFKNNDIKKDTNLNAPIITIIGRSEIFLENYKNILEYNEQCIKINTSVGGLHIFGTNLWIKKMTDESLTIYGKFLDISYK